MSQNAEKIEAFISLKDESLLNASSVNCDLAVQLGSNFVSFCILDHEKRKFLFLESYQFIDENQTTKVCSHIPSIINSNSILQANFKNYIISYVNQKSILIPLPLYSEEHKLDYFRINHPLEKGMHLYMDKIQILDAVTIYAISEEVKNCMGNLFPFAKMNHFSTYLIESFLLKYKNLTKKLVIVHVQVSSFEILVIHGKNLNFYNSFLIKTPEDFVYYILFVLEQLKLNPDTIELVLCGQIIRNSELFSLLHNYVRNIRFEDRDPSFNYSYVFEEIPKHYYYNLFNQFKCVL